MNKSKARRLGVAWTPQADDCESSHILPAAISASGLRKGVRFIQEVRHGTEPLSQATTFTVGGGQQAGWAFTTNLQLLQPPPPPHLPTPSSCLCVFWESQGNVRRALSRFDGAAYAPSGQADHLVPCRIFTFNSIQVER